MDFISQGLAQVTQAHPLGVLGALVFSLCSLYAMASVMRILLSAGKVPASRWQTTSLVLASNAWSTTIPGGQAPATVLTFTIMRSWGASVIIISWFIVLSAALSTMWLVGLGAASVITVGASVSLTSLLLTLAFMVTLAWGLHWATTHPRALARWARRSIPRLNKLFHRDPTAGLETLLEHIKQLHSVDLTRRHFAFAATWSLLNWLLDIAALWISVYAVTGIFPGLVAPPNHTTIAGVMLAYVTAKIAGTVQATPGGLGPVEAAMTATLVAVGMTAASALGAVFVYRMMSFVVVTVIGWIVNTIVFARRGVKANKLASSSTTRLSP